MRRITLGVLLLPAVVLHATLVGGCADSGDDPLIFPAAPELVRVTTALSVAEAEAGTPVIVTCTGAWSDGHQAPLPVAGLTLVPTTGLAADGDRITADRSGTYQVSCQAEGAASITPATLTVRAGAAARLVASLDRSTIAVGEAARVTCRVEDALGNAREAEAGVVVESSSRNGAPVQGAEVRGAIPGAYTVRCVLDRLASENVALAVVEGTPVSVRAALDRYEVLAGERVTVHCLAQDVGGNTVTVGAEIRVDVTPLSADATGLTPSVATPHHITCALPALSLESAPVELTVRPALPAELTVVEVIPTRAIYARNEVVELRLVIRDAFANEVPAANVEITALPTFAAAPAGPRQVSLLGDGLVPLTARVTSPTHQGRTVEGTITVRVDGAAPELVITFPARGEIVAATPGQPLTVRGTVTDVGTGVTSLAIGGQPVTIGAGGAFSTVITPKWGINVIEATAVDDAGNTRALAQSFELGSRFRRASPSRIGTARIDDGIVLRIGRTALDDDAPDVDDLATIARLAVERIDLAALIPSPATTYRSDCSIPFVSITGALRLYVDDVRYASPSFDFTPIAGGLRLRVQVSNADVDVHTSGDVCDIGVGLNGSARASRIVVTADLMVSASNGQVTVRVSSRNVQISGLTLDLRLPSIIDWAVDGIINLFSGIIGDELESTFSDVIASEVPPVIEQFLESIALATGIALPAPLSLNLGVDAVLGSIGFDGSGGTTGQDTTIYAAGTLVPEPLGAILQERQVAAAFPAGRALGVGIGFDLVNQALYALWYGGGIDMDLGPSLLPSQVGGATQTRAHLRALLPPVMQPSGDTQYPLELQAGELVLDLDLAGLGGLPPIQATLHAAFFARASVSVDAQGQLQLALDPRVDLHLDFDSSLEGVLDVVGFTQSIEATLSSLIPQLVGQVLRGIPLPSFDLSQMAGNYLPAGIVLGVGQPTVAVQPSYLVLEGNVVRVP